MRPLRAATALARKRRPVEGDVGWHRETPSATRALDTLAMHSKLIGSPRGMCRFTAATG
jgi:hypothetical protein